MNAYAVELRALRTFVTVCEQASFSRAAAALGYTQSAVSQHVASLEAELGCRLLARRPVAPTAAGVRLLGHARTILLRADVARAELLAAAAATAEELHVATSGLAPRDLVAAALRDVRRALPEVALHVHVEDHSTAVAALARGALDVVVAAGLTGPNEPLLLAEAGLLDVSVLATEAVAVALPGDHPLAGADVELAALADARWIEAPALGATGAALRRLAGCDGFRAALTSHGREPSLLLGLVARGHGLALTPASAVEGTGLAAARVTRPALVYRSELVRRPGPASGALEALVSALERRAG